MIDLGQYSFMADGGGSGDFGSDWAFDDMSSGNDTFISPSEGGYPGGIPGYDNYTIGKVAPTDNYGYNPSYTGGTNYDYMSNVPTGGGATDLGTNPDTGAARMDFTGMAPNIPDTSLPGSLDYGPGATFVDNSPNIRDILGPDTEPTIDNTPIDNNWTPLPVGGEILTPDQYTGAANNLVVNTGPYADTGPDTTGFGDYVNNGDTGLGDVTVPETPYTPPETPYTPPETPYTPPETPYVPADTGPVTPPTITETPTVETPYNPYTDEGPSQTNPDVVGPSDSNVPDLGEVEIVDNRPVAPSIEDVPDLGEVVITDNRPDIVRPVIPEGPVIEQPPYNPPIIDAPPIDTTLPPVVPEPEVPTIDIVAPRPVIEPPVIEPPVIEPPVIEPPVWPPIVEPPVIEPPVWPPIVEPPPPVWPPIVEPPPPTPPPQQTGNLNPGWIPQGVTPFYQTTNPTQAQYYWGAHPYMRTMADLANYNYVPNAPQQPWGYQTTPPSAYQFKPQDLARGVYTPMTQPQQPPVDMRTLKAPANPAIWAGMIPPSAMSPWLKPISTVVTGPATPSTNPTNTTDMTYNYSDIGGTGGGE